MGIFSDYYHDRDSCELAACDGDFIVIVAVGVCGSALVLDVADGPECLRREVLNFEVDALLWPYTVPSCPGIYKYSGKAYRNYYRDNDGNLEVDNIYKGNFETVVAYDQFCAR